MDDMDNKKSSRLGWWTAYRARRREKAQIRRQRANERADSPYGEQQRGPHSNNVIGSDGGGI